MEFIIGEDDFGDGACEFDHFGVAYPVGGRDDDFVAWATGSEDSEVAGEFASGADNNLRGLDVGDVVIFGVFLGEGGSEFGEAFGGDIFCFSVFKCLVTGVFNKVWGIKIRFSGGEAADIVAFGFEFFGFGVYCKGGRGGDGVYPRR